jgi:hypothetical protein
VTLNDPDFGDVALMESLIARSTYQKAATQALLILDAAMHRSDRPDPPMLACLRLMLGLHLVAEPDTARAVSKAFKAWLASTGQEATGVRGEAAELWTLVRELDVVTVDLPDVVRAAIARAALDEDLVEAKPDLMRFRVKDSQAARTAGELLRSKAPVLAATLADTLDPPADQVVGGSVSSRGIWFMVAVGLGVVRLVLFIGRTTTPSYPIYSNPLPAYEGPGPSLSTGAAAGDLRATLDELERRQVLLRGRRIQENATVGGRINLRTRAAVGALEAGQCGEALAALSDVREEAVKIRKTIPPVLDADIVLFDAALHRYCDKHLDDVAEGEVEIVAAPAVGARDAGARGKPSK